MKRIAVLLIAAVCILLTTGCDEEIYYEVPMTDITPKHSYWYTIAEDCGEGCLYKKDGAMWYYNYARRESVPLCSNPSCKHEDQPCFAYRPGRVYGFKDKLVIAGNDWNDDVEFKDRNEFVLEVADVAAQTVREVLRLERRNWCSTLAYGDKLFIGIDEEYYLDGDNMYASSDRVRVYLMVVSLETAEVELLTDCLLDRFNTDLFFRGIENGKLIFGIRYSETRCESDRVADIFNHEKFEKYMTYDIETKEIAEFTGQLAEQYFDGCAVYFDGRNVIFDREGDISRLDTGFEFNGLPLIVEYYNDGKAYFRVGGNEDMIYEFDTDTGKMYVSSFADIDSLRFVAERETEFVFATRDNDIVTLSKDSQLVFTELAGERINTVFENCFKLQKTPEEIEKENEKYLEELQQFIDERMANTSSAGTPIPDMPIY